MMKYLISVFLLCFLGACIINTQAQDVITTSGGEANGAAGSASYTVGQTSYSTIQSEDGTVTQGVQQPFEIFIIVSIDEADDISLVFSAYPNPTSGNLTLKIENYQIEVLSYKLFDFNGRMLESKIISSNEILIDMNNFQSATYFLKVFDGNREIKTFKILKN